MKTNGNKDALSPVDASRFGEVAGLLRDGDPARGFTRAAEICLERAEVLAKSMPMYNILRLAIDLHRHALFCEVAQDKARTQHDAAAFAAYQAYLAGTSDTPVAIGLPSVGAAESNPDIEVEDAEEEEETNGSP